MSTTDSRTVPVDLLETVRTKHRAVWESGDYPAVADQVIPSLGAVLVEAVSYTHLTLPTILLV